MATKKVATDAYAAAKQKYEAAVKAFATADNKLSTTAAEWTQARIERNAALPDGFYVEADASLDSMDDYPIYVKRGGVWYWSGDTNGFIEPSWLDDGDPFDIDVLPIADVKF